MPITVVESGTHLTQAIGVQTTLATITVPGTYQLVVDVQTMEIGDQLEPLVFLIPFRGGIERVAWAPSPIINKQLQELALSPVFASPISFRADIVQTAGAPRSFPWAIWQII